MMVIVIVGGPKNNENGRNSGHDRVFQIFLAPDSQLSYTVFVLY